MRLVYSEHFDVYQHLAAEAYFLHEYDGDVLIIWRSHDAVVCGKHQNACGEANYRFCHQNKIRIARRLSGGGTVFHDLGNINFTNYSFTSSADGSKVFSYSGLDGNFHYSLFVNFFLNLKQ